MASDALVKRPEHALAVIIGAGGMGMAVARRLAQRHRILIADRDAGRVEAAAATLIEEGGEAQAIACDITDRDAVGHLAATVESLGRFRVLAHVAGLSPSARDFSAILRVNLTGPALVTKSLLPLATQGTAAILVGSIAGHSAKPSDAVRQLLEAPTDTALAEKLKAVLGDDATPGMAYGLSKFGLMALCRRQASAWGHRGARIVSLSPGLIATPMGADSYKENPAKFELRARIPLQREGSVHEIADAVEFLTSNRASYISGTDLVVDGGLTGAGSK